MSEDIQARHHTRTLLGIWGVRPHVPRRSSGRKTARWSVILLTGAIAIRSRYSNKQFQWCAGWATVSDVQPDGLPRTLIAVPLTGGLAPVIRVAVDTSARWPVDYLLSQNQPFHQIIESARAHLRLRESVRDRSGPTDPGGHQIHKGTDRGSR
jgi:hypothetical protein